jgi:hypothetical protein
LTFEQAAVLRINTATIRSSLSVTGYRWSGVLAASVRHYAVMNSPGLKDFTAVRRQFGVPTVRHITELEKPGAIAKFKTDVRTVSVSFRPAAGDLEAS